MFRRIFIATILLAPVIVYLHKSESAAELFKNAKVSEMQQILQSFRKVAGEYSVEATVKFKEYSAKAAVKVEEICEYAAEQLPIIQVHIRNTTMSIIQQVDIDKALDRVHLKMTSMARTIREYEFSRDEFIQWGSELKATLSQRWQWLVQWLKSDQPAAGIAAIRAFKDRCLYEATGQRVLYSSLLVVFFALFRFVSFRCRRAAPTLREGVQQEEEGAAAAIMKAPTPLRERHPHPPQPVQRRRRCDSPAPTGAAADEENMAPAEEQLLQRLNNDSAEDLVTINGLGDKSADKIIKWRTKNGPLKNAADLSKIGLGNIVVSNLRKQQMHN